MVRNQHSCCVSPRGSNGLVAFIVVSVFVAGLHVPVEASTVLLSNLANTTGGPDRVSSTQAITQLFTTSNSPAGWYLESVTMPVTRDTSGQFFVSVWDNGTLGTPGTPIGLLTGSTDPSGLETYTVAGSGLPLAANTSYWIVWAALSGRYDLSYTDDTTTTGSWTIPPTGNTWGYTYDGGLTWDLYASSNGTFKFAISGSPQGSAAVPEIDPAGFGSVAALVIGAVGLLERRRLQAKVAA
jgi:hypothetical protein